MNLMQSFKKFLDVNKENIELAKTLDTCNLLLKKQCQNLQRVTNELECTKKSIEKYKEIEGRLWRWIWFFIGIDLVSITWYLTLKIIGL